jgi:sugar O-acyltransferase (sialic acid O-acetyltransferase NeuD family)
MVLEKLIIYGASFIDAVRLVHVINQRQPRWQMIGFIDDDPLRRGSTVWGYPVLGNYEDLQDYLSRAGEVSVFNNVNASITAHKTVAEKIDRLGVRVPSLIHPDVNTEGVTIGRGIFIPDGCIVGCNTVIGDYVTFRYGVVVSHDVRIGNFVFFAPGVVCTSHAVIEPETFLGACCTIVNGVTIGRGSVIGAKTLVNKNVRPNTTIIGIPGREKKM